MFRISPAMVVATAALFVALSGTSVAAYTAFAPANSVGTQQLINGSIRLTDIAPSTVRLLKGQKGDPGPQGPQGPQGLQGLQGLAGAPGGFNPAKVSYQYATSSSVGSYTSGESTATCPSGSIPIGGGGLSSVGKIGISNAVTGGWKIVVYNDTSITITIAAMVVCAAP